jgi:hypothetical protein
MKTELGLRARVRTVLESFDRPKSAEMRAFQIATALIQSIRAVAPEELAHSLLDQSIVSEKAIVGFAIVFGPRTPHGKPGQLGRTWGTRPIPLRRLKGISG